MELDPKDISRAWWKGALTSAAKGIPQGILLGIGGALLLWGLAAAFPVLGLASVFHGFLFTSAIGASSLTINPIGFVALNTALTVMGNFLTGGNIAVNAYKQDVEHRMNEARISQVEGRQQLHEQMPQHSPTIEKILASGPRNAASFATAEEQRAAGTPTSHTIH